LVTQASDLDTQRLGSRSRMRDVVSKDTVGVAGAKDSTTQCARGALPHTRELHLRGSLLCFITSFPCEVWDE
jgi:hypothetical protein